MAVADTLPIEPPAPHVGGGEALHKLAELTVLIGPQHEVPVIGHQAPSKQAQWNALERFPHHAEESEIVAIGFEDRTPLISTIKHMEDIAAWRDACGSWHPGKLIRCERPVNNWTYPLFSPRPGVTSDTSVAHLGGGARVPVWVAL